MSNWASVKDKSAYEHVLKSFNKMERLYNQKKLSAFYHEAFLLYHWVEKNWSIQFVRLAFSNELADFYDSLRREPNNVFDLKRETINIREYGSPRFTESSKRYSHGRTQVFE